MLEMLMGFALGAMAFTEQGRELGDKLGAALSEAAGAVIDSVRTQPAKQSSGAAGDNSHFG